MAKFISKFKIGESVWCEMNGASFAAIIISVTFYADNITYGLHNEEFQCPDSYLTIPEKGLRKEL